MTYSIREVDGFDGSAALDLEHLHELTFWKEAPPIDPEIGHWWIATYNKAPVAFAGLQESDRYPRCGYFSRVGVAHAHRGCRLQLRLMRAMELRARRNAWRGLVSDCTNDNAASANNFMKAGWRMFWPDHPWAFPHSIYWRKRLV